MMDKQVLFEDEFPNGPNGKRVDVYHDVVGQYLVRAWGMDGLYTQVFDTQQERREWLDEFGSEWSNIALFDFMELYKCYGEILRIPLT